MLSVFFGDIQAEYNNLQLSQQAIKTVRHICKQRGIKVAVNLGDFKNKYSPVDGMTINFGVQTCEDFKKDEVDQHVLLGNHDRYNLATDLLSWFPVLKKAGAITHDEPEVFKYEDLHLFFLPFRSSVRDTKDAAKYLASKVTDKKKSILCFHQELRGCKYNHSIKSKDARLVAEDLFPDKYLFCLGGHIHLRQNVYKNIWYVGSPFPVDWGEANQIKGFTIVDTETGKLEFVRSKANLLWDVDRPKFNPEKIKSGDTVRKHVILHPTDDVDTRKSEVEKQLEKEYPGVKGVAKVEFEDEQDQQLEKKESTEEVTVKDYIKQTCPKELLEEKEKLLKYLLYKLEQVNFTVRQNAGVKFLWAKGHNVLSYKDIEVNYEKPGIRVVTGNNKDWLNRSNGSGKSSALSLPMIALQGCTYKNQKNDRWARRKSTKTAWVKLAVELSDGRKCVIYRSRRPHKLNIIIDGKIKSEGNKKEVTQKRIEELTGITKESMLYVDQKNINSLLSGTDKDKKLVLEKIQNLEQYNQAQKLVLEDITTTNEFEANIKTRIDQINAERDAITVHTNVFDYKVAKQEIKELHKQLKNLESDLVHYQSQGSKKEKLANLKHQIDVLTGSIHKAETYVDSAELDIRNAERKLEKIAGLKKQECPTCLQIVGKNHIMQLEDVKNTLSEKLASSIVGHKKVAKESRAARTLLVLEYEKLEEKQKENDRKIFELRIRVTNVKEELHRRDKELVKVEGLRKKLLALHIERTKMKVVLFQVEHEKMFLDYCSRTLSRKGLPAYLNRFLCPKLNKAAKRYSDIFSDGEINIRFSVEDGQLLGNVLNHNGGAQVNDQSDGELRMASLITCFAQRDVQAPCNLMTLDEPGTGLDSVNAKVFAERLKEIGKHQTVLVASHNQAILSELASEETWEVTKHKGVSKLRVR